MSADRAEYIRGLRVLAETLEQNEDLPLPYQGSATEITFHYLGKDPVAGIVAAMQAIPCGFTSRIRNDPEGSAGSSYLYVSGELHGVKVSLTAFRGATCTRDSRGRWHIADAITARAPEAGA